MSRPSGPARERIMSLSPRVPIPPRRRHVLKGRACESTSTGIAIRGAAHLARAAYRILLWVPPARRRIGSPSCSCPAVPGGTCGRWRSRAPPRETVPDHGYGRTAHQQVGEGKGNAATTAGRSRTRRVAPHRSAREAAVSPVPSCRRRGCPVVAPRRPSGCSGPSERPSAAARSRVRLAARYRSRGWR